MKLSEYDANYMPLKGTAKLHPKMGVKGGGVEGKFGYVKYHNEPYEHRKSVSGNKMILCGNAGDNTKRSLVVLDIDIVPGTTVTVDQVKNHINTDTYTVRSPSGGLHFYYLTPEGQSYPRVTELKFGKSVPDWLKNIKGIDILGNRGVVYAVPTEWTTGELIGKYEVINDVEIATMDEIDFEDFYQAVLIHKVRKDEPNDYNVIATTIKNGGIVPKGSRSYMAMYLSGWLIKYGFDVNTAHTLMQNNPSILKVMQEEGQGRLKNYAERSAKQKQVKYKPIYEVIPALKSIMDKKFQHTYNTTGGLVNGTRPSPQNKAERTSAIAREYIDNHDVLAVDGDELRLYHYYEDTGIWVNNGRESILRFITNEFTNLSKRDALEVVYKVAKLSAIDGHEFNTQSRYIALSNGVYDIPKGELLPFDKDMYLTSVHDFPYDATATCSFFLNRLDEILEKRDIQLLIELFGYLLYPGYHIPMIMFFVGAGGNGKSVLFDIMKKFIGADNASAISLEQLGNKDKYKFTMYQLEHKMANIGGDIEKRPIYDTAFLKAISGGDSISVEKKGGQPYNIISHAKLLFAANEIPYIDDQSKAMTERLHILKFNKMVRGNGHLTKKVVIDGCTTKEELSGIFNMAMDGLTRLLNRNSFYDANEQSVRERTTALIADPIKLFINDQLIFDDKYQVKKSEILSAYNYWAEYNNLPLLMNARKIKKKLEFFDIEEHRVGNANVPHFVGIKIGENAV